MLVFIPYYMQDMRVRIEHGPTAQDHISVVHDIQFVLFILEKIKELYQVSKLQQYIFLVCIGM